MASSSSSQNAQDLEVNAPGEAEEPQTNQSVLVKLLQELELEENAGDGSLDQKHEMILSLINQIKDLEKEVDEKKEWAQRTFLKIAKELSNTLIELRMLRMVRNERTQFIKESTLKEKEDKLNKYHIEKLKIWMDAKKKFERTDDEIEKRDIEKAKLIEELNNSEKSESESLQSYLEMEKTEKKYLTKLSAWEEQKTKLLEDIAAERQKYSNLHQELLQVKAAQKEAKVKIIYNNDIVIIYNFECVHGT